MSSLIVDVVARAAFHTVILFSLYLLFAGHNAPGGGFVGGLVAGAGCVLVFVAGGPGALRAAVRLRPEALLGGGLLVASGIGVAAWLGGGQFLESTLFEAHLPLLGKVKTTTTLVFDIGVYAVVLGLLLALLTALGGEATEEGS